MAEENPLPEPGDVVEKIDPGVVSSDVSINFMAAFQNGDRRVVELTVPYETLLTAAGAGFEAWILKFWRAKQAAFGIENVAGAARMDPFL
jgi:hypothetical protein